MPTVKLQVFQWTVWVSGSYFIIWSSFSSFPVNSYELPANIASKHGCWPLMESSPTHPYCHSLHVCYVTCGWIIVRRINKLSFREAQTNCSRIHSWWMTRGPFHWNPDLIHSHLHPLPAFSFSAEFIPDSEDGQSSAYWSKTWASEKSL